MFLQPRPVAYTEHTHTHTLSLHYKDLARDYVQGFILIVYRLSVLNHT
jgi:hypothetical protein